MRGKRTLLLGLAVAIVGISWGCRAFGIPGLSDIIKWSDLPGLGVQSSDNGKVEMVVRESGH